MFGSRVKSNSLPALHMNVFHSLISWRCLDHELLLNPTMSFCSLKQINTKRQKWKTPTQDTHCRLRENTGNKRARCQHPALPWTRGHHITVSAALTKQGGNFFEALILLPGRGFQYFSLPVLSSVRLSLDWLCSVCG